MIKYKILRVEVGVRLALETSDRWLVINLLNCTQGDSRLSRIDTWSLTDMWLNFFDLVFHCDKRLIT